MTSVTDDLRLAADFPEATRDEWRKLVDGVLKGAPFEKLTAKTYDGLKIEPIYTRAKGAGLLVGAYHYFRTTSDPQAQVRRFYQKATSLELGVDLPLVLDVESAVDLTNTGPSLYAHDVREALEELAGLLGRAPILYGSPGFLDQLPDVRLDEVSKLWVAHYGVTAPRLPRGFAEWIFWQWSGSSVIPGVGSADANYFSGDLEALKAFAAG